MFHEIKSLQLDDCRIEYIDFDQKDAPVLLLLHSIRSAKELFRTLFSAYTGRYRVIAVDLRGHGNSCKNGPYTFSRLVDDIRLLIEHEGISRMSIIAASFACVPAQMFAVQYPNRVDKLVLLDGGFYALSELPGFQLEQAVKMHQSMAYPSLEAVKEAYLKKYAGYEIDLLLVEHEWEQQEDGMYRYRLPAEAYHSYLAEYAALDKESLFPRLQAPILLLLADETVLPDEHQQAFLRAAAGRYQEMVPHARLKKIPRSLHMLGLTNPQEVAEHAISFLEE